MKPTILALGSPVFGRIVGALLQIKGCDFARTTATLDDDWTSLAAEADAVVIELGAGQIDALARLRRVRPHVPAMAMSAAYGDDVLLEAERHELVAWANLPCKLEAPLAFLARFVTEGGAHQREHHEVGDVHYLVAGVHHS